MKLKNMANLIKRREVMEKKFNPEFMKRAIELSRKASLEEKTGGVFGAVIVKDDVIVGEGYNQVILTNDPTWHAEMHAIREASRNLGTPHLKGCVMYTSAECCPMCLATAYWAHLDHIYYASTTGDALEYGNFADIDIYDEIRKDSKSRRIRMSEHMRPEAVEVWNEFACQTDKVHY
jgi:tRNA(Arg) A34 adenosine deaminase TadA